MAISHEDIKGLGEGQNAAPAAACKERVRASLPHWMAAEHGQGIGLPDEPDSLTIYQG